MSNKLSTTLGLAAAALAAVAISMVITRVGISPGDGSNATTATVRAPQWTASAPGRVEPQRGEVRLSAQTPGRVVEIAVAVNDRVRAGDLLIRLDDEDARSRVTAAEAEALVRKRERDGETGAPRLALDRRSAEDAVTTAERALASARADLDNAMRARRAGQTDENIEALRTAITTAQDKLEAERAGLRRASSAQGVPLPTRLEAGLTTARADVSQAEAALERTRVRAPIDGTVLQIMPRAGELAAASPEQALVVMGDLSRLRVRAEVEERDVAKVRAGQAVVVRSDAFPGREFAGRVATLARTLAPARLAQRGPRRPNDLDTLEVLIDLDPSELLLPGLRVDVFFKADEPAKAEPAKAEPAKAEPTKAEARKDPVAPAAPAPAAAPPAPATKP